jgi:hypothetical protein
MNDRSIYLYLSEADLNFQRCNNPRLTTKQRFIKLTIFSNRTSQFSLLIYDVLSIGGMVHLLK